MVYPEFFTAVLNCRSEKSKMAHQAIRSNFLDIIHLRRQSNHLTLAFIASYQVHRASNMPLSIDL